MAVSLVGACTGSNSASSGTSNQNILTLPGGSAAGDVYMVILHEATNSDTLSTSPATATTRIGPNTSGAVLRCYAITGTLSSTDISNGTLTFTWTGAGHKTIECGAIIRGADESQLVLGTANVQAGSPVNSVTMPSVTTTVANSEVVSLITIRIGTGLGITPVFPSGYGIGSNTAADAIEKTGNGAGSANYTAAIALLASPGAAGSYGGGTITTTNASTVCAYTIAIAPSATSVNMSGVVANITTAAPAGTVSAPANLAGPVSTLVTAAPAGTVSAGVNMAGPVATLVLAAPTGTTKTGVNLVGPVANISIAAPAGTVGAGTTVNLTGPTASITLAAPAGTTKTGANLAGPVATLTLAAPAGTVTAGTSTPYTASGVVAGITLAAPAGTVTAGANLTGPTGGISLSAPPGTVTALTVAATWRFVSPIVYKDRGGPDRFWARVGQFHSISILKYGSSYQQVVGPSPEEIDAADLTYLGGHEYVVDGTEAAALTAAGYGSGLTLIV